MPDRESSLEGSAQGTSRYDTAERLHSTTIHLLRLLRLEDIASGIGPARLSALSVLVFAGPKSLKEMAKIEQVKPPTMSRVIAGLERARLVKRQVDPRDARRIILTATARGTKALHEARLRRVQLLAEQLIGLSAEELQIVSEAERLIRRISG